MNHESTTKREWAITRIVAVTHTVTHTVTHAVTHAVTHGLGLAAARLRDTP